MANSINDLKGFWRAVQNAFNAGRKGDMHSPECEAGWVIKGILSGEINEADYIKQWSEHDEKRIPPR